MRGTTHLAGGMALGLLCGVAKADPLAIVALEVGSLLPDIDNPQSMLGHYVPLIGRFCTHRGFTHSLLFQVIVGMVLAVFTVTNPSYTWLWWVEVGIISHVFLDLMNRKRVQLLFPLQGGVTLPYPNIRMGTWQEVILCLLLITYCLLAVKDPAL